MSLVAYDTSSDEEEGDLNDNNDKSSSYQNGNHEFTTAKTNGKKSQDSSFNVSNLCNENNIKSTEEVDETGKFKSVLFTKLPEPKSPISANIQEEDDEFLHKKATPYIYEKKVILKGPVQITIPSLSDFKDIDDKSKQKKEFTQTSSVKSCKLLDILPKPKEETLLQTSALDKQENKSNTAKFIPDSVKNKTKQNICSKLETKQIHVESDDDDDNIDKEQDFFSLNTTEEKLPEVNMNEINAMVAKKAAKLAEASARLIDSSSTSTSELTTVHTIQNEPDNNATIVDEKALHILVGSRAKRRKMEEVNVVELSSEQVLPNKDEWLRTALASSTTYQLKGVLTDEEPAPGTRKKHQITYLAHQAKSNELELQAMWSANRHTRRQTQSKYGF